MAEEARFYETVEQPQKKRRRKKKQNENWKDTAEVILKRISTARTWQAEEMEACVQTLTKYIKAICSHERLTNQDGIIATVDLVQTAKALSRRITVSLKGISSDFHRLCSRSGTLIFLSYCAVLPSMGISEGEIDEVMQLQCNCQLWHRQQYRLGALRANELINSLTHMGWTFQQATVAFFCCKQLDFCLIMLELTHFSSGELAISQYDSLAIEDAIAYMTERLKQLEPSISESNQLEIIICIPNIIFDLIGCGIQVLRLSEMLIQKLDQKR